MVFEDLVKPWEAKKYPARMLFYGIAFSILAIIFSLWVFPEEASLVVVFLVVVMTIPLMYFTLREEEAEEYRSPKELWLLTEHGRAIRFLLYLFIGLVIGFSLFFILSPDSLVQRVFSLQ